MVRDDVRQHRLPWWDASTRWAGLLVGVSLLASVLAISSVWPPESPTLEFAPGETAAVGPPSSFLPSEQASPDAAVAARGVAPGTSAAPSPSTDQPSPSPSPDPGTGSAGSPPPSPPSIAQPAPPPVEPAPPAVMLVAAHSGKCADVFGFAEHDGARAVQWDCHGGANQRFQLVTAGSGHVTLRASHSGKCLGVHRGSLRNEAPIVQLPCTGAASQQFQPQDVGGGAVRLVARHSGKCLDVFGSSRRNETPLIQWPCHGDPNQRWRYVE